MNKERILKLADHLGALPSEEFSQRRWTMKNAPHRCGSPSCMGGHALSLFDPEKYLELAAIQDLSSVWVREASRVLDIDQNAGIKLFLPGQFSYPTLNYTQWISGGKLTEAMKINNVQAAAVLKYFAETEIVDFWTPIYGPIEKWDEQSWKNAREALS